MFRRIPSIDQREQIVLNYTFPPIAQRVVAVHPEASGHEAELERGLREWLLICLWAEAPAPMPSASVDWLWHEFIIFTRDYIRLCQSVYGHYLHHAPEGWNPSGQPKKPLSMQTTYQAWERSSLSRLPEYQPVLWTIDETLGIQSPTYDN